MPRASRMSALEQSIHKFAEEPTKSAVKPDLGLSFYLLGDAYDLQFVFLGRWLRHTVWGEQAERRADKVDAQDNLWLSGCSVRAFLSILKFFLNDGICLLRGCEKTCVKLSACCCAGEA